MRWLQLRRIYLSATLVLVLINGTGCTDEFYLSEKEVAAYRSVLSTQADANLHFDNLQGRVLSLQFDSSGPTPQIISTNLLDEMRRTEMVQLESGPSAVSLDRLRAELESQISTWVAGRLRLYTGDNSEEARLTRLDTVSVSFLTNPTFTYNPARQSIAFDLRVAITINCTIEVNALDWFLDFLFNINGTYPLSIVINDMKLGGEASVISPFADAGRVTLQFTPQITGPINVLENGTSVPGSVRTGVRDLLSRNLASRVDEIFVQNYDYFALSKIGLSPQGHLEVTYRPRPHWLGPHSTDPKLHVVARAADGKLYHARKATGGWSSYSAVPFPSAWPASALTDPALFHSGGDQLELAAVNQNNALVYGHWRDEAWSDWQLFTPGQWTSPSVGYRGKPAVVASAPGQAEVIVRDGNGNLWHLRRFNGKWLAPSVVPLSGYAASPPPYRDPVALHVGNKIVVVFVNGQNRPTAIAFDLETGIWGQPSSLSTQTFTNLAPAAVASGDRRFDMVYVGPDGIPHHRVLKVTAANFVPGVAQTGISLVGTETALNEIFNATPVLVASGYGQLELIGRGLGNRMFHNHYTEAVPSPPIVDGRTLNPGWQGWTSFVDNLYGAGVTTNGQVSEFAAAATRTGRTELVARGFASTIYTQRNLFHNNYESQRYGNAPWKTVHWRGFENAGAQVFLGRPALVVVDRNFELALVGNGNGLGQPTPHSTRMGESNAASFNLFAAPFVRTSSNVIDPIVLSSGPGITDVITMRTDGRPVHTRSGGGTGATLGTPSGVTITRMAAVGYGNGAIDLIGLGNDYKLYHWRYRNPTWTGPALVSTGIISAAALVHVGAGQLELLAVDFDYKLLRWRFVGTSWLSPLVVPGNFRVDNVLFGPGATSSWGDGSVDVVVVNKDTQELNHRRIGPGDETCILNPPFQCPAPRAFANLGARVWDKPLLTAFSPTRLNVLTMQGLKWYSIWASRHPSQWVTVPPPRDPRLLWSAFEYIGGDEMVVGSTTHSGSKNFAAVAIRNGRVFINRFADGRWTGFQPVIGQTPEMLLRTPVVLPALAAHGG